MSWRDTIANAMIRAYHGSPYSFDKFAAPSRVAGTGEGGASFGHGLYFAEHEPVAMTYKTMPKVTDMDWPVVGAGGEQWKVPSWVGRTLESGNPRGLADLHADWTQRVKEAHDTDFWNKGGLQNILDAINAVKGGTGTLQKPGHMYEVNINANPNAMLNWDKPFAEQSPQVQGAINNIWEGMGGSLAGGRTLPPFTAYEGGTTGSSIYPAIATSFAGKNRHIEQAASEALLKEGVPGIQYLDQASRPRLGDVQRAQAQWPGIEQRYLANPDDERAKAVYDATKNIIENPPPMTNNYVVFDPGIVDIVRKYGIAGAAAPLGALADPSQYGAPQ